MNAPVPIFLSFSNQYVPYAAAAIRSVIAHASKERMYYVHVFYSNISAYNVKKIAHMQTENVEIVLRNINDIVKEQKFFIPGTGISRETYYRIFAIECLKNYEKLIYLDSDVVVLRDIAELYDEDLGDHVLGAVWNYNDSGSVRYIENNLKIPSERCFNAGVLVFNTKKFIDMKIQEECVRLQGQVQKPLWADQDLLNLTCWQNTKLLDERWNVQSHGIPQKSENVPEQLRTTLEKTIDDPFIVHYSGVDKPWLAPQSELAEFFWRYARQTEFYEEIIYRNVGFYKNERQVFLKYLFPFNKVTKGSRVVLYGMGKVGTALYAQNRLTNYCRIHFCVDQNFQQLAQEPIPVLPPKTLKNDIFDFVVIALENEKARKDIAEYLKNLGVPSEKIVAEDPLKPYNGESKE